jgi:hypothetical protein
MSSDKKTAGVWLAFAMGQTAEANAGAACLLGHEVPPTDEIITEWLEEFAEEMFELGVSQDDARLAFENGHTFMAELRTKGALPFRTPPAVPEDPPPLVYTPAERQLTGKPDGRLS